jgi:Holliday junction resolvase RusA-like endonuclease
MKYIIQGPPIPLQRHRTNNGRTYDPQAQAKESIGWDLYAQRVKMHGSVDCGLIMDGAIRMVIVFYMPIPKSLSIKKQDELCGTPHHKRPDLSNLIKFVEDAANGILYADDAQIASIKATKLYDLQPRTEFTLKIRRSRIPGRK